MKHTVTKIALALVAMISMTGCPSKKKNNQLVNPYGYSYTYGGTYCTAANGCYGQAGYGQMFATGLGKIQSSQLHAELALNLSTASAVNNFSMTSWGGSTQVMGTLNIYSSSSICPIPPGQYQVYGAAQFGSGYASHSFIGSVQTGGGYIRINFPNNFITSVATQSVMGPTFPFAIQNSVEVISPYGSCGGFVME